LDTNALFSSIEFLHGNIFCDEISLIGETRGGKNQVKLELPPLLSLVRAAVDDIVTGSTAVIVKNSSPSTCAVVNLEILIQLKFYLSSHPICNGGHLYQVIFVSTSAHHNRLGRCKDVGHRCFWDVHCKKIVGVTRIVAFQVVHPRYVDLLVSLRRAVFSFSIIINWHQEVDAAEGCCRCEDDKAESDAEKYFIRDRTISPRLEQIVFVALPLEVWVLSGKLEHLANLSLLLAPSCQAEASTS